MPSFANHDDDDQTPATSREVIRGELAGESTRDSDPPSENARYLTSEPLRDGPRNNPEPTSFRTLGPPDPSDLNLKNPLLASALGFVLGPLGLLYTNIPWAVGLGLVTVAVVFSNMWILLPGIWFACALLGFGSAVRHNAHELLGSVSRPAGQGFTQAPFGPNRPGGPRR